MSFDKQKERMAIEMHPFEAFVPEGARILVLGSFPGKESTQQARSDDWYYGANRNQFWKILEIVYNKELKSVADKQRLFRDYGIAITDIIRSCSRSNNSASDKNLIEKIYNKDEIRNLIELNSVEKILFTSKGVEEEFSVHIEPVIQQKGYRKIVLITPSPVYRRDTIEQKAEKYRKEFPALTLEEERARFRDRFGDPGGITITKGDN